MVCKKSGFVFWNYYIETISQGVGSQLSSLTEKMEIFLYEKKAAENVDRGESKNSIFNKHWFA